MRSISYLRWNKGALPGVRYIATFLVLSSLITWMPACAATQKKQAQDLVKAGSSTSDQLAVYYDDLAQKTSDWLLLYSYDQQRTGTAITERTKKDFKDAQEAFVARAVMARKLKVVYDSLGKLIDYDAPGEVTGAVNDLKDALEKVANKKLKIPIKGITSADTTKILDLAIKAIVGWVQMRAFRRNAPKAEVVLDAIIELFDKEKDLYAALAQEYNNQTMLTAQYLVNHDIAIGTSAFQRFIAAYGLQIYQAPGGQDAKDVKAWTLERIKEKETDLDAASTKERSGLLDALKRLRQAHSDFMRGRKARTEGNGNAGG